MTLRDFLKANKSLTDFKRLYHELSKTKITYRQIEANLLTAGEDFIIKALNINALNILITGCGSYWIDLNTKWNEQLNSKTTSSNKTLGYWLKMNNLEEKFKNAYLREYPKCYNDLNQILSYTSSAAIKAAFKWDYTLEGFEFWLNQSIAWAEFCNKINNE